MIAPVADLEVILRQTTGAYAVEVRFTPAGSNAPVRLLEGDPPLVQLDAPALLELQAARDDMALYATLLSARLYADVRLREALARALAASAGAGAAVRLRLVLDERDPGLHTLHWEALEDPSGRGPLLGLSERVRMVRFLSSADLEPLRPRPLATTQALVVISSGEDLDAYQLAPLDVEAEVARARAALGDLPTTVVQSSPTTPVTLNRLVAALRDGPDLLYLVAHGTLHRGQPFLWLEDDDGFAARVNAKLLIEQIQALTSRPLLVILGSCQSAGNNAVDGALTALGPQLASAGIGAVIAFQGNVQLADAATMLPVLLRELRRDGQLDRALAAARASLSERGSWWQPVLWLRMLDGQLWTTSEPVRPEPAASAPPHNLPAELDTLVGRDHDLATVISLLSDPATRLLTLVGPGGAGKTRLALALAWQLQSTYPDGVWLIELTSLRDPALLLPSIAQVLGVKEVAPTSLLELLQNYLRSRRMLLILDNFEQIAPAAPQVAQLLVAAPGLEVVVTSRTALRISGEQEFAVSPLPIPDPARLPAATHERLALLAANPAVALFVRRAAAVRQGFVLNEHNMEAVQQLVIQLDGLPLAIELAAARSRLLTPQAMLGRLGDRLGLLTGGARDRAAHQQTLRATIAWSYDLLDAAQQRLFERLAVFAGGCTLEAAEAVCNPASDLELDLFEGIAALVEESLLRAHEHPDGSTSFSMLTTIRAFALERLAQDAGSLLIWKSFADYYLALAQAGDRDARGPNPGPALDLFEREHVNLRTALDWALETDAITTASDLAIVLWWFWHVRGYLSEGRTRLAAVLARADAIPGLQVASLRLGAGNLALAQADYADAQTNFQAALAIYEQERTLAGITRTLNSLGITALRLGQYEQARSYYERSLALCRELNLRAGIVTLLNNLGLLLMEQTDFGQARTYYEESLALARVDQDRARLALALSNLGLVAIFQHDLAQAHLWLREALPLCRELGDQGRTASVLRSQGLAALQQHDVRQAATVLSESLNLYVGLRDRSGLAYSLDGIASLAAHQGDHVEAVRLWGAAHALRSVIGAILPPSDELWLEYEQAPTLATLDPAAFAAATAAGAALDHEAAVREALAVTSRVMASDPAHPQIAPPPVP
ncbi:MAG: tetratricopeptide repeat protein [Oscillochloridaceae bacterium umkhey_bin13]